MNTTSTARSRNEAETETAGLGETNALVSRWQENGDRAARDELFVRFLPLARSLASRYRSPSEPLEDLVQVASMGLLGAINRFDPSRGTQFSTFAVPTILGELKRYFRNTGWSAHVPRSAQELSLRVDRAAQQLTAQSGRSACVAELAEYLQVTTEAVLAGIDASTAHYAISLDAPASVSDADMPETLGDSLGHDDSSYALVDTTVSVSAAMTRLPDRQRRALELRLDRDLTQIEIGRQLDCSQMQVSRLLRRAMTTLQELTRASLNDQQSPPVPR
jgi:RNA polymerase sigma-B factor